MHAQCMKSIYICTFCPFLFFTACTFFFLCFIQHCLVFSWLKFTSCTYNIDCTLLFNLSLYSSCLWELNTNVCRLVRKLLFPSTDYWLDIKTPQRNGIISTSQFVFVVPVNEPYNWYWLDVIRLRGCIAKWSVQEEESQHIHDELRPHDIRQRERSGSLFISSLTATRPCCCLSF